MQRLNLGKQFETNITDLGIFNNRVQFTTDVYSRKAFDLVDFVTTSGIGGQRLKQGNNADMETKGISIAYYKKLKCYQIKMDNLLNFFSL
jgi:hypothetical protein